MTKAEIVGKYCAIYPQATSMALARMITREHPKLYSSIDTARTAVRYTRGQNGARNRKLAADKTQYRPPGATNDGFKVAIPKPCDVFKWAPVRLDCRRLLVVSDFQIPFHDPAAIEPALDAGSKARVDAVLINGDLIDFYAISRFQRNPEARDLGAELDATRRMLVYIHHRLPNARLIYKIGNHEERWEAYLSQHCLDLLGVPEFRFERLFSDARLSEHFGQPVKLGIQFIPGRQIVRFGHLDIVHGHETGRGVFNPVNAARGLFLRGHDCILCGHHHHTSEHSERTIRDKAISCWSTGCLCDLHPEWMPHNRWNHGFAIVHREAGDNFRVDNCKIIQGKVY